VIVVDASAVLEVLLRTPVASTIERRLFAPGEALHAPHLIDIEITHVLRRYAAAGDMSAQRGLEALEDLADLSVRRYPHDIFLPRVGSCAPILPPMTLSMSRLPKRSARRF
jgi:predicted nucleic acid-binding protein